MMGRDLCNTAAAHYMAFEGTCVMPRVAILAALASLITAEARACPPGQDAGQQLRKEGCVVVKPIPNKPRPVHGDLSAADKENLDRAMSRNVLQSIDDQLRRQRLGN